MLSRRWRLMEPSPLYHTTMWSKVLSAAKADHPAARASFSELCQSYWYPLFAYLRRRGHRAADAEDTVQSFFAWFLEKNVISYATPERGRFRGFIVASLRQFLARQHEYATARKRRPSEPIASIDLRSAESTYEREFVDDATPDQLFEYTWAVAVLDRAMQRLRIEQIAAGKGDRFEAFHGALTSQSDHSAAQLGKPLGLSEGAVRVALHRLRQRFGEILREEIGATLAENEQIDEELAYLMDVLSRKRA